MMRSTFLVLFVLFALFVLVGLGRVADADADADNHTNMVRASIGGELAGSDTRWSGATRVTLGYTRAMAHGPIAPTLGAALTFAGGGLFPRGTGTDLAYFDYGAQLEAGIRLGGSGFARNRLYASFALLRVGVDEDKVLFEDFNSHGKRLGIGINYVGLWAMALESDSDWSFLAVLFPDQLELTWLDSGGSSRYGAAFSWGI